MKLETSRMRATQVYWIVSGEGECGTWERKIATERGIKRILAKERCNGDRWAHAYGDIYKTKYGGIAGFDVEGHSLGYVTDEAGKDVLEA